MFAARDERTWSEGAESLLLRINLDFSMAHTTNTRAKITKAYLGLVCYIYKENSVCIARGTEGDPP